MRVCHSFEAVFDDPNLVACGGFGSGDGIGRAGLHELAAEHVRVPGSAGANAAAKIPALVAGMIAGADSISDLDV